VTRMSDHYCERWWDLVERVTRFLGIVRVCGARYGDGRTEFVCGLRAGHEGGHAVMGVEWDARRRRWRRL
jgi:hypothetical protein